MSKHRGQVKRTLTLLKSKMDSLEYAQAKRSHLAELLGYCMYVKASWVLLPC